MTGTISNHRRNALLMGTAAVGLVAGFALTAAPALAQCTTSGSAATCTSGGNPYASGITYTPSTALTVITNPDLISNGTISNNATAGSGAAAGVVNNGTVNTSNAAGGVNVSSDTGNVSLTSPGSITTTGTNITGALATTGGAGTTTVNTTGGTINASGRGIDASTTGTGAVSVTAGSVTAGVDAIHVVSGSTASGVNNAATVSSTAATTTGATSNAIYVAAPGNIGIISGTANSVGGAAILANSSGGNVVALVNGNTTSTGADAINLTAGGTGVTSLTIGNANVVGGVNGVTLSAPGGVTLVNNGSLRGGTGYAVVTTAAGPATITNGGVMTGPLSLGGAGNTVNNTGALQLAGTSSFGSGGTNTLNNSGTVYANVGVTPPTTVNVNGLTTFNNQGTVSLANGNGLNLNGAAFNGGTGSRLAVVGNGANGVLTVGSSTGTTTVVSNDLVGGAQGQLNLGGSTLVRGATSANNFALASGPTSQQGFVTYRLGYNPTGGVVTLYGLPGAEVFEALAIPDAAQAFWTHSADVWTARATEIRDSQVGDTPSRRTGWELWGQPYGGVDKRNPTQTFSYGGFNFASAGTRYETIGLQMGVDGLYKMDHGYGFVGITAGLEQQQVDFRGDYANDIYLRGGNIGVYAGMNWNGIYANVLGKVDIFDMSSNFYSAGYTNDQTVKAYGGKAEVGYRYPVFGFFIEPAARVSGVSLDFDDMHNGTQNLLFHTDTVVQAQAGGRIGFTWKFDGMTFTPYAGGFAVGQSSGRNALTFATGTGASASSIDLVENRPGTFTRVEYGVESADFYGLKTFLRGTNDFGDKVTNNWSAQMGVRFSF